MIALLMPRWGVCRRGSWTWERRLGLLLLVSQDDAGGRLLAGSSLCLVVSCLKASSGLCCRGQGSIWLARPACRNPRRCSLLCASCGSVPSSPGLHVSSPCRVQPSRLCASLRHLHGGRALQGSSTQGREVPRQPGPFLRQLASDKLTSTEQCLVSRVLLCTPQHQLSTWVGSSTASAVACSFPCTESLGSPA